MTIPASIYSVPAVLQTLCSFPYIILNPYNKLCRPGRLFPFCRRGSMRFRKLSNVTWLVNGHIRFPSPVWLTPECISFWKATV